MRNSENSSTRSKFAAVTRIGLLVLIFAVVFATVLSCGASGESATLNNGATVNVAQADETNNASYEVSSYQNSGVTVATLQQDLHSGDATAIVTSNLSNITDTGGNSSFGLGTNVSGYRTTRSSVGLQFWNGGSSTSWGVNNDNWIGRYTPSLYAVLNVEIPSAVKSFLDEGYQVTVTYTATIYGEDNNTDLGGLKVYSGSSHVDARYLAGETWGWSDVAFDTTWSSTFTGGVSKTASETLSKDDTLVYLVLGAEGSNGDATGISNKLWLGVRADGHSLTYTITKGSASDTSAPTYVSNGSSDGYFSGLGINASSNLYSTYEGLMGSDTPQTGTYTLGYVKGKPVDDDSVNFTYYRSMSFTVTDGSMNSAAFYHGIGSATLKKSVTGGESTTATPGNIGNGDTFFVKMSATSDAATTATVTVYFAESGTFTLTLTDDYETFNGRANSVNITFNVYGIDTTDPTVGFTTTSDGVVTGAPTGSVQDFEQIDSATWVAPGNVAATFKGMDPAMSLANGNSAWVYFFDVKYSFFPFTSEPTSDSSAITNGTAMPFAISTTADKVSFAYSTYNGVLTCSGSDAMPLSGTTKPTGAGYYAFFIYVADMAGNLCSEPLVYYVKVDNQSVSGVSTEYQYDADGTGTDKKDASDWINQYNGWINQYMVGTDGKVYVDISFKLNPSGNIVTFKYGGNYYDSAPIADKYDFTAKVTPEAAGEVSVSVTGNGDDDVNGITTLVEGLTDGGLPRAMLQINVGTLKESGADWTVTLTLIYSRGGTAEDKGEFSISNSNEIGVAAGCGGSATPATVDVKIDTQSISDFAFTENGGYVSAGDYSLENGGIAIDTSTVAGRKWYTTNGALSLTSNTSAGIINEYMLYTEYSNYATYFGWKVYTAGETVNNDIKNDLASFKSKVAGAGIGMAGAGTGMAGAGTGMADVDTVMVKEFKTFFGNNMWQDDAKPSVGSLLPGQTSVNVHNGGAGVRVLYIMTLDQAGNANFSVYYLFVDPTS